LYTRHRGAGARTRVGVDVSRASYFRTGAWNSSPIEYNTEKIALLYCHYSLYLMSSRSLLTAYYRSDISFYVILLCCVDRYVVKNYYPNFRCNVYLLTRIDSTDILRSVWLFIPYIYLKFKICISVVHIRLHSDIITNRPAGRRSVTRNTR